MARLCAALTATAGHTVRATWTLALSQDSTSLIICHLPKSYAVLDLTAHRKVAKVIENFMHGSILHTQALRQLLISHRNDGGTRDALYAGTTRSPTLPCKDLELFLSETTPAQAQVSLSSSCSSAATLSGTKAARSARLRVPQKRKPAGKLGRTRLSRHPGASPPPAVRDRARAAPPLPYLSHHM